MKTLTPFVSKGLFLLLTITFVSTSSCKKFDDGPLIGVGTKKHRLRGHWVLQQVLRNGEDYTATFKGTSTIFTLDICNQDDFFWQEFRPNLPTRFVYGSWTLGKKESSLSLSTLETTPPNFCMGFEITRLTQKELWLKSECSNFNEQLEFHYSSPLRY